MMYGTSDEWWALFLLPVLLWVPCGPFLMGAMGVWCARRPGLGPRLWSVLLPLVPVVVSAIVIVMPLESWDRPGHRDDVLGYLVVYVLGITVLPWLLGYGITRAVRAVRARRGRGRTGPAGAAEPTGPESPAGS
ncbi:hypothetical protein [Streptomyces lateritius]|uniref:hypothetical protein n=1 Tax=Streptomyces lateritius TaxID=67313 RepID=UPI001C8B79C9|nr:hypothetical protein [Streptomyces lateritius]MBX9422556.1 hypothetical protein [Streptomyces lateritius]